MLSLWTLKLLQVANFQATFNDNEWWLIGKISEFNGEQEEWIQCVEKLKHFVAANGHDNVNNHSALSHWLLCLETSFFLSVFTLRQPIFFSLSERTNGLSYYQFTTKLGSKLTTLKIGYFSPWWTLTWALCGQTGWLACVSNEETLHVLVQYWCRRC